MADHVVEITIRTNVPTTHPGFNTWDALVVAMGYGIEELIGRGEYTLVSAEVVQTIGDDETGEDEDEDEDEEGEEDA